MIVLLLKRLVNVFFMRVPVGSPVTCTGYNAAVYNSTFGQKVFDV